MGLSGDLLKQLLSEYDLIQKGKINFNYIKTTFNQISRRLKLVDSLQSGLPGSLKLGRIDMPINGELEKISNFATTIYSITNSLFPEGNEEDAKNFTSKIKKEIKSLADDILEMNNYIINFLAKLEKL